MGYGTSFVVQRLTRRVEKVSRKVSPTVVRYAANFVVLDEDPNIIQQVEEIITIRSADMGLELKPSKTTITHTGKTFHHCRYILVQQLQRWAKRQHPHKGMIWISNKYWHVDEGRDGTSPIEDPSLVARSHTEPLSYQSQWSQIPLRAKGESSPNCCNNR